DERRAADVLRDGVRRSRALPRLPRARSLPGRARRASVAHAGDRSRLLRLLWLLALPLVDRLVLGAAGSHGCCPRPAGHRIGSNAPGARPADPAAPLTVA